MNLDPTGETVFHTDEFVLVINGEEFRFDLASFSGIQFSWSGTGLDWPAGDTVDIRLVYSPPPPPPPPVPASCDRGWLAKLTMGYDIVSTTNFSNESFGYDSDTNFGALSRKKIPHGPTSYTIAQIFRSRTTNTNTDTVVAEAVEITVAEGELPDGTVLNFGGRDRRLMVGPESDTMNEGRESWDLLGTDFPDWEEGSYTLMCANLPPRLESAGVKGRYLGLVYHQQLDFGSVPRRAPTG